MNIEQLLVESLQLLGLGMGAVFVILSLLIGLISVVSRLVPDEESAAPPAAPSVAPSAKTDQDHIAAITAAVHLHRKRR